MHLGIFTYYFPPDKSVGIRRIIYWTNYFLERNIKVSIFTIDHGKIPSIISEKKNITIFVFKKYRFVEYKYNNTEIDARKNHSLSLLKKIKRRIINPYFGQLFDFRLLTIFFVFLYFFKNKEKQKYVDIDIAIASTPPFFILIWGVIFKKIFKCKLILDYRDQFSDNEMFSGKFVFLERIIDNYLCKNADLITVVSKHIRDYYLSFHPNVKVIYNGYDENIFKRRSIYTNKISGEPYIFTYVGSITHSSRVPHFFLNYLSNSKLNYKLQLIGDVELVIQEIKDHYPQIQEKITFKRYIEFDKVPHILSTSDFNLVFEEKMPKSKSQFGTIPTKVYEYMSIGRPIISEMSKDIEAYSILANSGLLIHNFTEADNHFDMNKDIDFNLQYVEQFSRFHSTSLLLDEINGLYNKS
jgi:hypothetical protein